MISGTLALLLCVNIESVGEEFYKNMENFQRIIGDQLMKEQLSEASDCQRCTIECSMTIGAVLGEMRALLLT